MKDLYMHTLTPGSHRGPTSTSTAQPTTMTRTVEMFAKPPRAKPRVMMHWDDAGWDNSGHFVCPRCKHEAWYGDCSKSDFTRGVPCPNCNATTSREQS